MSKIIKALRTSIKVYFENLVRYKTTNIDPSNKEVMLSKYFFLLCKNTNLTFFVSIFDQINIVVRSKIGDCRTMFDILKTRFSQYD
jgi:hypothetical protein